MVEKAKDIVERLRKEAKGVTVNLNPWPRCAKPPTSSSGCGRRCATGSHEARA